MTSLAQSDKTRRWRLRDGSSVLITIPRAGLVLMVGASSSGKTTFAKRWFPVHSIVQSDEFRLRVCDNLDDEYATRDAFEVMALIVEKRLTRRLLTVIDAMNITARLREPFLPLARRFGVPTVALRMECPLLECEARHSRRADRAWDVNVLREQYSRFVQSARDLESEGVQRVVGVQPDEPLRLEFE